MAVSMLSRAGVGGACLPYGEPLPRPPSRELLSLTVSFAGLAFFGNFSIVIFQQKGRERQMTLHPGSETAPSEEQVVTKALLRASDSLGVQNAVLARVVGVSEATVSRMRKGTYVLPQNRKVFELAVLFIRLYRSLDTIVGGDEIAARAWLRNTNTVLNGTPVEKIQSISGLMNVIDYLDARRAVV